MPTNINNTKADRTLDSTAVVQLDRLWSLIFDALPDGISVHSPSSEVIWANRALCDLYGKTLSELEGKTCSQAFHEGDLDCPHEQAVTGGHAVQAVKDLLVSGRLFAISFEPLFDDEKRQRGFLRVMRDVTEIRNVNRQLLEAERFATLGQLLSGVAHDVGTPLNVISGYSEFLMMKKSPEDEGYKELTSILDQTRRIAAIFGQALDLARPAQGRTEAVDLNAIVAQCFSLAGHHLKKTNVTTSITCRIPKPLIYGEASQLKQALFIILLNAGRRVGTGGSLTAIIDEAQKMPEFLELVLLGTEANGVRKDFSMFLREGPVEADASVIGLHLAMKILGAARASIGLAQDTQAPGLVIHFSRSEASVVES